MKKYTRHKLIQHKFLKINLLQCCIPKIITHTLFHTDIIISDRPLKGPGMKLIISVIKIVVNNFIVIDYVKCIWE